MFSVDADETPKLPPIATVETIALPVGSFIVPSIVITSFIATVGAVGDVWLYVGGPLNVIVRTVLVGVFHEALTMAGVALPSSHECPLLSGRIVLILSASIVGAFVAPANVITIVSFA